LVVEAWQYMPEGGGKDPEWVTAAKKAGVFDSRFEGGEGFKGALTAPDEDGVVSKVPVAPQDWVVVRKLAGKEPVVDRMFVFARYADGTLADRYAVVGVFNPALFASKFEAVKEKTDDA
jgi:hypothetical protein